MQRVRPPGQGVTLLALQRPLFGMDQCVSLSLRILLQTLRTLAYIHNSISVCHRDIKPQNLLVRFLVPRFVRDLGFIRALIGTFIYVLLFYVLLILFF